MASVLDAYGQTREGVVSGTVYDASGDAAMPGVKVIAKHGRKIETAISDQDGAYSFRLAPGTYEMSASGNVLYRLKRSAVVVSSGVIVTLNLYPSFRVRSQALMATGRDEYSYWPASRFEFIVSRSGSRYFVEFKEEKSRRKIRSFRSTAFERVKITQNALTVLGQEVTIDKKGRIGVVGDVLIDDNGKRTTAISYVLP